MLTGNAVGNTMLNITNEPAAQKADPMSIIIPSTQEVAMEDEEPVEGEQEPQQTQPQTIDYQKEYETAEKRRRDLQSYHDKVRTDLENQLKIYGQIDVNEYKDLKALKTALVNHPDLLDAVQSRLTGQTPPTAQSQPIQPQAQLQLPAMPADFDPYDMFNPSTNTGRWYAETRRIEQAAIAEQLANIVTSKLTKSQQQQLQEEARRQEALKGQQELEGFLVTVDDPATRDEFLHFIAEGPKSIGLPEKPDVRTLFSLYQLLKTGSVAQQTSAQQSLTATLDSKIKQSQAAPITNINLANITGQDTTPQPLSESEQFFAGLKQYSTGIKIV